MAVITPVSVSRAGLALTVSPSSSTGDSFNNTGAQVVIFQNSSSQGGGSAVTVTFTAQAVDNYGDAASLHNVQVSIASSSFGLTAVGPFSPKFFNDGNGLCQMTYSASGLSLKVINMAAAS